jgi:diguanylate cyclase (GGDEF)-like protein/PAS domain S-box-containing protein
VTVPISFTGDVAGFLFDLLSDLEAIVSEVDADTFAIEFINDRVHDLLGYEPMDVIAVPHFWRETVAHPDDRQVLVSAADEVLRHGVSRATYRALTRDGEVVWLSSVARLSIDQEGRRRVRVLDTDVTAMKHAEQQARESEQRFRLLSDASRDSVIVQVGDAIIEVNHAFCDQFGWSSGEALGLRAVDYIAPESGDVLRRQLDMGSTEPFEVIGVHRAGEQRWYSAQSRATRYHGQLARVVVLTDITDLKLREQSALHNAEHDQLTGLANRAAFQRRVEQDLARSEPDSGLGLLFCDLNGFKDVNDVHGHAAGDSVLQQCAERLKSVVRASDPVFRLGGDEFVILLPRLSDADAERVIELKCGSIERAFAPPFPIGQTTVPVGIAVGTAICPRDGITPDALVRHADTAMYAHKRATKPATSHAAPVRADADSFG